MYGTISNTPRLRATTTYSWVYKDNVFNKEELDAISLLCEPKDSAKICGITDPTIIQHTRISDIQFYKRDESNSWIFDRFNQTIVKLNNDFYNFNLNGYEKFQYTEYSGEKSGKYDWHLDIILGDSTSIETRKLTVILGLSEPDIDYKGGDFEINIGNQNSPVKIFIPKGRIIAIPSFISHRVKPVIYGLRRSIVIWVLGPKFV